ncbi:hypothetical protein Phum_PHUM564120 [Pediculus humanus corporis]|uniref:Uncharacterized protein n=1 Tax=Pediculus humanus subsp. corporis TaxID=121224 RepID=E0W0V0_PEDHC|nr:uncharacterized protein Phum_PHUM564120 [Pediculus humanus corporis]EEB19256.1 hypothetical protein Phum_PHUM564120 [Pediculus humanus corporis]
MVDTGYWRKKTPKKEKNGEVQEFKNKNSQDVWNETRKGALVTITSKRFSRIQRKIVSFKEGKGKEKKPGKFQHCTKE